MCKFLRKNVLKNLNLEKTKQSKENNETKKSTVSKKPTLFEDFPDSAYDLLKKLLELDCDKRLSAENALKHQFFLE